MEKPVDRFHRQAGRDQPDCTCDPNEPGDYSSLTPPIDRAMGDPIKPDRGVFLCVAIAWWQIQITMMLQFRCHTSRRVIPQIHSKSCGQIAGKCTV